MNENALVIYKSASGSFEVQLDIEHETVWMDKQQIAKLFGIDRSGVSRHISKIFKNEELSEKSNVQKMHVANSDKPVEFYSLDIILSVGYRTDSKNAVIFRQWANRVLKQYLVQGYALNEKRLQAQNEQIKKLQSSINLLNRCIENQVKNLNEAQKLAQLMTDFAKGLALLDDFDNKNLDTKGKTEKEAIRIEVKEFLDVIEKIKGDFASDVFANPKDESFSGSVNQIYQTFGGNDCYPGLEEKAAMLLYLVVKNHSFTDGNKRIGASCFLYFMEKNGLLYKNGEKVIDNATLFALTLLIAESKPDEMETIKQVVISVLNRGEN